MDGKHGTVVLQTMHVAGRGVVKGIDGVVLSCAAAGIVRTFIMRLQEPISGVHHPRTLCACDAAAASGEDDSS